jgi:PAS domain S-box-containing protein
MTRAALARTGRFEIEPPDGRHEGAGMRHGFDRGVTLGIVLLAAMMVGIAITSYVNTRNLRDGAARADRSQHVVEAVGALRADARKLQAAQRAFLISGVEDRLVAYREAAAALRAEAASLNGMTEGEQRRRAGGVEAQIDQGIAGLDVVIKLRRDRGLGAVVALARASTGRSFVDPLLEALAEMEGAEREQLASREAEVRDAYAQSVFFGIAAAGLGLLALGMFVLLLARSSRARARDTARLAEQRELLSATLASIGDAVIATDAAGAVTFLNAVAADLTGWSQEEARGVPLEKAFWIVNEATRQPVENPALRALKEGTTVGLADHTVLIAKDGTERPIDDSAAPITSQGKVTGAVLVFRDITEKKAAQAALREREERYRLLVTATSDVVYRMSADWEVMHPLDGRGLVPSSAEPLRGWMQMNLPACEHDRVREAIGRAVANKQTFEMEHQVVRADGTPGWTHSRAVPILDPAGAIVEWFGTARDVTEQKRAAEAVRESEARFRALVTATSDVVYRMSPDWAEMRQLVGREFIEDTAEPRRSWVDKYIHPQDRPRVTAAIAEAVRNKAAFEMEHRVVRVDGAPGWIFSRAVPLLTERGEIAEWFGTASDVTARKEAQEALARVTEESERRKRLYETALSNTPDLVYVFGPDHRFYYANEALLRMWGKTWDEAIGKTCLELGYEPWHASMHDEEIERVVATKGPIRGEVPFSGTQGHRIYDYIFVPVLGSDGEVEAVAGTTRDVTERKAMEEALREADRKKDDFIALLAHELRNPLAPIRNGLQVIRLAPDRASLERAQQMMDRQLAHMVRLIDDLLDASRISRNKMELRRDRVELADVVNSAVEAGRPLIEAEGHELTVSLPEEPVYLDGDLTRLAQVFSNLLTNSAKYTPRGGKVWLAAQRHGTGVAVTVRDTGLGIPAGSLSSIFDMFSQVDRSVERSTGGLGIGLALVKGLVEMHGGTVAAQSEGEGKGSTFTVTLPVLGGDPQPDAVRHEEHTHAGAKRRILVVDDNRDGADSLAMMLTLLGDEVRTAHDGLEAVEQARAFRPEVILMDVGMPKLNGYEATKRIRRQEWGKEMTVIALTGWGHEGDRAQSKAAGCDGHLVKPVSLADLQKLLGDLRG